MRYGSSIGIPVVFVGALVVAMPAWATIGNCGFADAPTGYNNQNCQSVCVQTRSELVCELETLCTAGGASGVIVTSFGSSAHDVSAWGGCSGTETKFCCVFDEGATAVDTIELSGTPYDDESLRFTTLGGAEGEYNLEPWDDDHIDGYIRGNAGDDHIDGSNFAGPDYDDHLYGQNGTDVIAGNKGGDFLSGGNGTDYCSGNDGNDTIWGGDGDDFSYGNEGNDVLCDAAGYNNACATDEGNFMDGGTGDDKLWFDQGENPNLPCPNILVDLTSTAGPIAGTDYCGDNADFTQAQLPLACDLPLLSVAPVKCEGAN